LFVRLSAYFGSWVCDITKGAANKAAAFAAVGEAVETLRHYTLLIAVRDNKHQTLPLVPRGIAPA
jgi:hypothetical protein